MVLHSTRWLAISYFTYFIAYGVFLPFWGVWLKGEGLTAETIGVLLGAGLIARFIGCMVITPLVKQASQLIHALRLIAGITLLFACGFWLNSQVTWLFVVLVGFSLFFAPMIPLTDSLAATWQRQMHLDYGRVRLWGSLAFVLGSAGVGVLVSQWGHPAILYSLVGCLLALFVASLLRPHIMPQSDIAHRESPPLSWRHLLTQKAVWRFLLCVTLLQGAHAGYYSFSAIYWQDLGYSASTIGYLWSLGVVAEIIIFALSRRLFQRWSFAQLLLLSALCGLIRWSMMASFSGLGWLILIQVLHCGTFTVCHLAAMRFISQRNSDEVIRLQAVYSGLAMGGGVAMMTIVAGFLFEHWPQGVFWLMAVCVIPVFLIRQPSPQENAHECLG